MLFGQTPTHSVTLTWILSTSSGVTGQNIKRALVTGGPYTQLVTLGPTVTTYIDTTATIEGQKYCYVGTATGPGGESANSNETCGTIPFSAPQPITGLSSVAK